MNHIRPLYGRAAVLTLLCLCVGCQGLDPGADAFLVNAEKSYAAAFETVDLFLKLERQNEALVKEHAPEVHAFADTLRDEAPAAFDATENALKAYRANRGDPGNRKNLNAALAAVGSIAADARTHIGRIDAAKGAR